MLDARRVALVAWCATACGTGGEGTPDPCLFGDADAAPELELIYLTQDLTVAPLHDGEQVPLLRFVEGGRAVFVGVRAKNVGCDIALVGSLVETCSGNPRRVARDVRPVELVLDSDGFAAPRVTGSEAFVPDMLNLLGCPAFVAVGDVDGAALLLEVSVQERGQVHALPPITIIPTCDDAECTCICDADFDPGAQSDQCATIDENDVPCE